MPWKSLSRASQDSVIRPSRANLYVSLRRCVAFQIGGDRLHVGRAVPGDGHRAAILGALGWLAASQGHPQHNSGTAALDHSLINEVIHLFDSFIVHITALSPHTRIRRIPLSHLGVFTRVGTLIVATIYLQLIQNRYMFRSFTVLQCSHQQCVQPVASDVEVVGYL